MARFLSSWVPVVLWAAVILSAANDEFSDANTRGWLERMFGALPGFVNAAFRKGGHVVAYAIMGLLAWRASRRFGVALAIAVAVAIADESLQSTTLTREGSPYDVLLDACGALLALICVPAVRARLGSRASAD